MQRTELYEFEDFRLDVRRQRLYRAGEQIPLAPKAVELLTLLIENQGRVLEKEEIIEKLWQETFVEEANLTQTIYLLRKALGKTADNNDFIVTLPKRGYKFLPPVRKSLDESYALHVSEFFAAENNEAAKIIDAPPRVASTDSISKQKFNEKLKPFHSSRRSFILIAPILLAIGLAVWLGWRGGETNKAGAVNSIAVLPFSNLGGDDERNDYLGLGLADTLITRLGQAGKINVRSTEQVRRFAAAVKDPLEIGRRLGVDSVLTGSLQQTGERVRVNAQLIRVADGQVVWTDRFDEKQTDFFALQDALTARLTSALTLRLTNAEQQKIIENSTENVEAFKLYWQGRFYWNKRTPEWIQKAIRCFEESARLDPNFALAYAGLADSYALTVSGLPPGERFPKAKAAASRALELNENLAEAHTSLAFVLYKFENDWAGAEAHFRRAVELNDSYPTARHWYGEFLSLFGRFDEGLSELRRAEQLDPFSIAVKTDIGEALYRARRYDEAIAQLQEVLEFDPNFAQAYRILKRIYVRKDLKTEAVKADLQLQRLTGAAPETVVRAEKTFAAQGWQDYWRQRLKLLFNESRADGQRPVDLVETLVLLEENDRAILQLKQNIEAGYVTPLTLKIEPLFDPLRSDAGFQNLLKISGLLD